MVESILVIFSFQQHWLKTDFEKWRDEDDSDDEAGNDKDMQLEEVSEPCRPTHQLRLRTYNRQLINTAFEGIFSLLPVFS